MATGHLLKRLVWQTTPGVAVVLSCLLPLVACGTDDSETQDWWADSGTDAKAGSGGSGGSSHAGSSGSGGSGGSVTGGSAGSTGGSAGSTGGSGGSAGGTASDVLKGFWLWEKRVNNGVDQPPAAVDGGVMRVAFGTGNNKCHYLWNETTGSDFNTECTYTVAGDRVTLNATADPDGTAAGWSCAHLDWVSWNDRPAVQYSSYKFVGDRLWLELNTYWGGVNGDNKSCKRFPFWESESQVTTEDAWIVFKPVTQAEWNAAGSGGCTDCEGTLAVCE